MWKTRLHILNQKIKHRDHVSASAGKQTFSCAALYPQRVVSALVAQFRAALEHAKSAITLYQ